MKVPKMYKSSDRYNAGVDVIYDDDSKLQYAPFIYATAESGDNGADDSGDEEGEDSMIVIYDVETEAINKSFNDLKEAVDAGKIVVMYLTNVDGDSYGTGIYYLVGLETDNDADYLVTFGSAYYDEISQEDKVSVFQFEASDGTSNMTQVMTEVG